MFDVQDVRVRASCNSPRLLRSSTTPSRLVRPDSHLEQCIQPPLCSMCVTLSCSCCCVFALRTACCLSFLWRRKVGGQYVARDNNVTLAIAIVSFSCSCIQSHMIRRIQKKRIHQGHPSICIRSKLEPLQAISEEHQPRHGIHPVCKSEMLQRFRASEKIGSKELSLPFEHGHHAAVEQCHTLSRSWASCSAVCDDSAARTATTVLTDTCSSATPTRKGCSLKNLGSHMLARTSSST